MSAQRERHVTRELALKSVGPGWHSLLIELYDAIDAVADPDFYISQVKEKFGELRIYESFEHPILKKIVSGAMLASSQMCEDCGHLGQINASSRGWIRTLCPRHDPDLFNEPLEKEDAHDFPSEALSPDELINLSPDKWGPVLSSPNTPPETLLRAWQGLTSDQRPANYHADNFYNYMATNPNTPREVLISMAGTCHEYTLSLMAARPDVEQIYSVILAPITSRYARCALAKNPLAPTSALLDLYKSPFPEVRDSVLRNPSCPQNILTEASLNPDLAPEIILNPSAPPKLLESLLLLLNYSDVYSAPAANKIISRLKAEIQDGYPVSKPSLAWLMRHPDKDIRLRSAALSYQNHPKKISRASSHQV